MRSISVGDGGVCGVGALRRVAAGLAVALAVSVCGVGRAAGAVPAAGAGILSSPYAIGIGAGAIAGVTTWVLLQNSNPASPTVP